MGLEHIVKNRVSADRQFKSNSLDSKTKYANNEVIEGLFLLLFLRIMMMKAIQRHRTSEASGIAGIITTIPYVQTSRVFPPS